MFYLLYLFCTIPWPFPAEMENYVIFMALGFDYNEKNWNIFDSFLA